MDWRLSLSPGEPAKGEENTKWIEKESEDEYQCGPVVAHLSNLPFKFGLRKEGHGNHRGAAPQTCMGKYIHET